MTRRTIRRIIAPLAGLALVPGAVVVGTGPAASASVEVAGVQYQQVVTVDDLRQLVAQLAAAGEVTLVGARRLEVLLLFVEHSLGRGTPGLVVHYLEEFKVVASTPRYVPSESARAQLIAAADGLIALL
jgi:hypothetical protein